jgi:AcrR family transcriptional regulator
MSKLREKQKEERQRRILEAARQKFRRACYRDVTIEAIAEEAELSAMTVFNYYGSKGGLLLSLVAESDRHLITKIGNVLDTNFADATAAVVTFSQIIFDHAFSYLDQRIWAHVLATSILKGSSTFGHGFADLEQELADLLTQLLQRLKQKKLVALDCDTAVAARVIYNVHNARFVEFASDPDVTRDAIDALIRQDLRFMVKLITPEESEGLLGTAVLTALKR